MLNSQILSGLGTEFPHARFALGPEVADNVDRTSYTFTLTLPELHRPADMYIVLAHFKSPTSTYPTTHTLGGLGVQMSGWPGTNLGTTFLAGAKNLRLYAPDTTTLTYVCGWNAATVSGMAARIVGLYHTRCALSGEFLAIPTPAGYTGIPNLGTGGLGGTSVPTRFREGEQVLLHSNAPASNAAHTWAITGAEYGAVPITYTVRQVFEGTVGYRTQALVTIPADDMYTVSLTRASGTDYFMGYLRWVTSGRTV